MSYGVALRNGVPFTLGTIAALCVNATTQWNPLRLWPDGIATPGMWISPRDLTSQWADYTGTTPVAEPGTVADSSNPVGLALDIRAGAPEVLGPELWANNPPSVNAVLVGANQYEILGDGYAFNWFSLGQTAGDLYLWEVTVSGIGSGSFIVYTGGGTSIYITTNGTHKSYRDFTGGGVNAYCSGMVGAVITFSVREVPGNHMLQSTSAARPLLSAYDGQTLGPGNTYDSAGYPVFQLYDGVDDGMATAAFSAGTLINGMDCMIAVRRDSANHVILGPYNATGDFTKYIGNAEYGYNSSCCTGVGSPTVWVDNVQLTNGWASELYTAVTVGDWHILEFRGADLSTWIGVGAGNFGSGYNLNGPRGDILLFPSTTPTADKDAARQWLADYYGVTLA